jgi:hypothetical protein
VRGDSIITVFLSPLAGALGGNPMATALYGILSFQRHSLQRRDQSWQNHIGNFSVNRARRKIERFRNLVIGLLL